ncbi:MAG: sulfotransferase domain-containing protein [bacterium]
MKRSLNSPLSTQWKGVEHVINGINAKPSLIVRYVDMNRQPFNTLKEIPLLLGLDVSDGTIQKAIETFSFKTLASGKQSGNKAFFRKGIVGDWMNHMDEKTHHLILAQTRPVIESLGLLPEAVSA